MADFEGIIKQIGVKPYYQDEWCVIYHADCRDILPLIPDKSIDLVLTDPPYAKDFLWCYELLARQSSRLLVDGFCICLTGWAYFDEVLNIMGKGLSYYWALIMPQSMGCVARYHPRQILNCCKSALIFSNGQGRKHPYIFDMFESKRDKRLHIWGQPVGWFQYYIDKLGQPSGLILDPFLGSGTTCYCAKKLNRYSIGIEIEEKYCDIADKRCSQSVMKLEV